MLDANNKYYRALVCVPPKTRNLLKVLAFFAPKDIPTTLIMNAITLKFGMANSMLHCLRQRILTVEGCGLRMPPELQEHLRDSLSFAESAKYIAVGLSVITPQFPANLAQETGRWDYYKRLVPHALAVCNYAEQFDLPPEPIANLLSQIAFLLYLTEQFPLAEPVIKKILQIAQADTDQPHPHSAYWLKILASVLEKTGRPDLAQPLLQKAAKIDKHNQ